MENIRYNKNYNINEIIESLKKCNCDIDVFNFNKVIENKEEIENELTLTLKDKENVYNKLTSTYISLIKDYNVQDKNILNINSIHGNTSVVKEENDEYVMILRMELERQSNCRILNKYNNLFEKLMDLRDFCKKNTLLENNLHILKNMLNV